MALLRSIVHRLGQRTGMRLLRSLPRGVDVFYDLRYLLPGYRVELILDIGANVGRSALHYVRTFPNARIISVEPVAASYAELRAATAAHPQVECVRAALSDRNGELWMALGEDTSMNRVVAEGADGNTERVPARTLDDLLGERGITQVHYLKIDTEGAERAVLAGAEQALSHGRIDLIELEAGMNTGNQRHVPLHTLADLLEGHGYVLFGLYEQLHEWPERDPALRRTNAVFLSPALRERYRGKLPRI